MRITFANALHQKNEILKSKSYFNESENIFQKDESEKYLYGLAGFLFCDLLLSQGQVEEVLKRAKLTIEIAIRNRHLISIALDQLTFGRAYLSQAMTQMESSSEVTVIFQSAADHLNQAVDGLRKAGQQYFIPLGLFARAELYRLQGDFPSAWDDLEEAHDIAERGEMQLWLTDYHLAACRLCLAEHNVRARGGVPQQDDKIAQAQIRLKNAETLVKETGYHRRDPELLLLQAQFHLSNRDKENARIWLNKAKKRFNEMGIREWDFEVRELEQAIE
jgi:tetratricopeptide (TPR) repeat protein